MAKKLNQYLVTYHAPAAAMKKMKTASPEEMKAGMDMWKKWGKKCGTRLVDFGSPLMPGTNLRADTAATPSKRKLTGYSMIKASSLADAKKMLKGHPHLTWSKGCEIEVHELMPLG